MKSTIHELKNFTSKIMSKKSLLILPSIVLLFLVNACTPLPTGGPVSTNVIYKVFNKHFTSSNPDMSVCGGDITPYNMDINNDNVNDITITGTCSNVIMTNISNIDFCVSPTTNKIKSFSVSESIDNSLNFNSQRFGIYNSYGWFPTDIGSGIEASPIPNNANTHYIGFRYKVGNDYHYGWMNININVINIAIGAEIYIVESAYNNLPNQPILAGKK